MPVGRQQITRGTVQAFKLYFLLTEIWVHKVFVATALVKQNVILAVSKREMWHASTGNSYFSYSSYSTWCDGHPVAIDNWALLFLLLRRLQTGALLHVADWLVSLSFALGAWPGSGQQGLTHIQRRGCRGRLGWRFRCAVEVIWGQRGSVCVRGHMHNQSGIPGDVTHRLGGGVKVHSSQTAVALNRWLPFKMKDLSVWTECRRNNLGHVFAW